MAVNVDWDNAGEKQTLIHTFAGDWSWYECKDAMQVAMFLQESNNDGVNFIYDLSESTLTTRDCLSRMQRMLKLELYPAPKRIIIVDKSFRLNTLQDMLVTIVRHRDDVHFVEDLEAARDLLSS